jgi:hypothetical protein
MRDERHEEILSGPAEEPLAARIAAALEATMSVEPSADFLARVRGRVVVEQTRAETVGTGWPTGAAAPVLIAIVVIGAAVLRRAPAENGDPGAARPRPTVRAPRLAPEPAPPARRPPALRVAAPSRAKPALAADVRVEPGQLEALAQLAGRGVRAPSLAPFVIESLGDAALPELRPASLPRFVSEPLAISSRGWQEPRREIEDGAPIDEEGSGS